MLNSELAEDIRRLADILLPSFGSDLNSEKKKFSSLGLLALGWNMEILLNKPSEYIQLLFQFAQIRFKINLRSIIIFIHNQKGQIERKNKFFPKQLLDMSCQWRNKIISV
ncbi:hypothetical protein BpHYR1_024018 [Brachionus plicatilis]|uniref:Uncharacterized protein n=1 Tax=Brachionus plicatilis TaxID=10195 RepID=A0A3M7SIP2_BRAPC|nr:hypothetical protein BpHYR1_024018 [Brachionus plicatilis]